MIYRVKGVKDIEVAKPLYGRHKLGESVEKDRLKKQIGPLILEKGGYGKEVMYWFGGG